MFTVIDLFAGIGGLTEGFRSARANAFLFKPILLVDMDNSAAQTYQRNRPRVPYLVQDISALSGKAIRKVAGLPKGEGPDVLIGGPPCQGFSILRGKRGLEDPRNACLKEFLRLVSELEPRFVLLENVPNLLHSSGGGFREEILEFLTRVGYLANAKVLNAHEYGVPQIRERAFVVAFRKDLSIEALKFPQGRFPPIRFARSLSGENGDEPILDILTPYISVEDAIGDLPRIRAGQDATQYDLPPFTDYQQARRKNATYLHNHDARAHSASFLQKIGKIQPGGSNQDLDGRKRFDRLRPIKYFSQAYGRLHRDGIAYTITTHFLNPGSGRFLHYRELRSMTVREAARFQSFDDDFVFTGTLERQQEHVGNAVPPLLARSLAEHFGIALMEALARSNGHGKQEDPLRNYEGSKVTGESKHRSSA